MVTYVGTSPVTSGTGSINTLAVPLPAGSAEGQLAILVWTNERAAVFPTISTMLPDWTVLQNGNANFATLTAYKFLTAADISAGSVTVGTLTAARRAAASLLVFSAAGAPTVANGTVVAASGAVSTAACPAVTASDATGKLLHILHLRGAVAGAVISATPASGFTEVLDSSSPSTSANANVWAATKDVSASGSQAAATHTMSSASIDSYGESIYIPEGAVMLAAPTYTTNMIPASAPGVSDGKIVVTWSAVPNASAYTVKLAPGALATTGFVTKSSAATSPYTIDGLAAGTYTVGMLAVP